MGLLDGIEREATLHRRRRAHALPHAACEARQEHHASSISSSPLRAPSRTISRCCISTRWSPTAQMDEAANRYAHWAMVRASSAAMSWRCSWRTGPNTSSAWYGLIKIGAVVALINTNLRGQALAHSITIANARTHRARRANWRTPITKRGRLLEKPPVAWATGARAAGAEDLDAALGRLIHRRHRQSRARRPSLPRHRFLHLHLRHHRPAESRQFQPYAHALHDVWLCGRA